MSSPSTPLCSKPTPDSYTLLKSSATNLPLADKSVQMVVTSPPYYGLRTYDGRQNVKWSDGSTCPYGNEKSVQEYVAHSIEVLRELRRVLKDDGVVFWNVGDSYCRDKRTRTDTKRDCKGPVTPKISNHIPNKSLCLIPERVAIAAQDDGWIVRSMIIWKKPNCVPESVTDRPTHSYEVVIMLTKNKKYYWDHEACQEPGTNDKWTAAPVKKGKRSKLYGIGKATEPNGKRNIRDVWSINTQPYSGAHFAAFPEEIPRRCIKAASRPGDVVLDPFGGSGTTGKVALEQGRTAVLADINYGEGSYEKLARERIAKTDVPLLDLLAETNASTMQDRLCQVRSEKSSEKQHTTKNQSDIAAVVSAPCVARPRDLRYSQEALKTNIEEVKEMDHGKKTQQGHDQPIDGRMGTQRRQPKNGSSAERSTSQLKEDSQLPKTRRKSARRYNRKDGIEMNGIIEMEMGTAASPEDTAASLQSECEMWKEADEALAAALDKDCDNLGRIFRKLKKKCLAPGRDGKGWAAQLKERGLKVRTVDSWIQRHEELHGFRSKPLASVARGSGQHRENNEVTGSRLGPTDCFSMQGSGCISESDSATGLPSEVIAGSPEEKGLGWTNPEEAVEQDQIVDRETTMDLDTPEGRYNYMYKAATKTFVYRGGANRMIEEWRRISADITKMLESFNIQEGGAILPRKEDF